MAELSYDYAHLTVLDSKPLPVEDIKNPEYLLQKAQESFKKFYDGLMSLERVDQTKIKLPKALIELPREKPLPVEAPKTRWEAFADKKGLKIQKKEKKVYDEQTGEWNLRYGYKKSTGIDKDWMIEVPHDYEGDPFAKKAAEKADRVNDQAKRERRNKKRALRASAEPSAAIVSVKGKKTKDQIKGALKIASHPSASASMNQFNKVKNKVSIYEKGSTIPKIFDRTKGQDKSKQHNKPKTSRKKGGK